MTMTNALAGFKSRARGNRLSRVVDRIADAALYWVEVAFGARRYMKLKCADLQRRGARVYGNPLYIHHSAYFDPTCWSLFTICEGVVISADVRLLTHDYSVMKSVLLNGLTPSSELRRVDGITLQDHCFVGMGALIMPGVVVGKFAIVAAGAVVVKSVSDGTIVGGNPAKEIGRTADLWKKYSDRVDVLFGE